MTIKTLEDAILHLSKSFFVKRNSYNSFLIIRLIVDVDIDNGID